MRLLPVALMLTLALPSGAVCAEQVYGRVYDTRSGAVFAQTRIVLFNATEKQETLTDSNGSYWFQDVPPGAYLVRIVIAERGEIVGRAVVYPKLPTTIVNLDLARLVSPDHDDNY